MNTDILKVVRDNIKMGYVLTFAEAMIIQQLIDEAMLNHPSSTDVWIPVSERLPEEGGRYWCYVEEQNSLGKSHYQWNCAWNGERWWVETETGGRVTHWQPLPAAPKV